MSEEDTLKENEILFEASKLFNFTGMSEPLNKIYLSPEDLPSLPLILALSTSLLVNNIDFDPRINCLIKR
jgi:WASH complex subunit strumpellin